MIGSLVPIALGTLYFFGCCVLPFHQELHDVVPLCHIAAKVSGGSESDPGESTPAREKDASAKKVPTKLTARAEVAVITSADARAIPRAASGFRSFISLGALRCDDDVGHRLSLLATLLI